jgi:hypothetical protein
VTDPWQHPDAVEASSDIAGRGLFARADLAVGTVVARPGHHPLVNHSCDPNLGWTGDALETLRPVAAGEELVVDYAMGTSDPDFLLRCHCPSYRCRQMVEGRDWQIPQLRERYAGHWSPEVAELIAGFAG